MDRVIIDTEFLEYGLQAKFIENIKENAHLEHAEVVRRADRKYLKS